MGRLRACVLNDFYEISIDGDDKHIVNNENLKEYKKTKKPLKAQYILRSKPKISKMPECVHITKT